MKKNLIVLGTRPEIIKMAPIIKTFDAIVIHTGQHRELADEAFNLFEIQPTENLKLMTENQTPNQFIANCTNVLAEKIQKYNPDNVWVHGDTASAFCGALVGKLLGKKIFHVEAGLRTHDFNNPFPEEMFRTQIDNMSDVCFAPTKLAAKNLKNENINADIYVTGNTIVDSLNYILKNGTFRAQPDCYILFTMHRRENFGRRMEQSFKAIKKLTRNHTVIFPCHPNPNVREIADKVGLKYIEPLDYLDFLRFAVNSKLIISDSGGIQEEVPTLQKPLLIMREKTERPEILDTGNAYLTDFTEKDILEKVDKLMSRKTEYKTNPFGDGKSSNRIIKIYRKHEKK